MLLKMGCPHGTKSGGSLEMKARNIILPLLFVTNILVASLCAVWLTAMAGLFLLPGVADGLAEGAPMCGAGIDIIQMQRWQPFELFIAPAMVLVAAMRTISFCRTRL
jgi:hypothetical protein